MYDAQYGYFLQSEEAMVRAGALVSKPHKYHNIPTRTLLVLGSADKNIPSQVTAAVQDWATRTLVLGGYGHEIQDAMPSSEADTYGPELARFVRDAVRLAPKPPQ